MDWLSFFSSILNSWPLALVVIVFIFRDQLPKYTEKLIDTIINKLSDLTHLTIKNTKAQFAQKEVDRIIKSSDTVAKVLAKESAKDSSFLEIEDTEQTTELDSVLMHIDNTAPLRRSPSEFTPQNDKIQKNIELDSYLAPFDYIDSLEEVFVHFEDFIDRQFSKVIALTSMDKKDYSEWNINEKLFYLAHDEIINQQMYEEIKKIYEMKNDDDFIEEMKNSHKKVSEILKNFTFIIVNNISKYETNN